MSGRRKYYVTQISFIETGTFSFWSVEASYGLVLIFITANTLVAITVWWVSSVPMSSSITLWGRNTNHCQPVLTTQTASSPSNAWLSQLDPVLLILCAIFLLFRRSANTSKTVEYFKPLGRARMDRLFSIYQIDFEMFGYNYEIYAGSWSAWSSN